MARHFLTLVSFALGVGVPRIRSRRRAGIYKSPGNERWLRVRGVSPARAAGEGKTSSSLVITIRPYPSSRGTGVLFPVVENEGRRAPQRKLIPESPNDLAWGLGGICLRRGH